MDKSDFDLVNQLHFWVPFWAFWFGFFGSCGRDAWSWFRRRVLLGPSWSEWKEARKKEDHHG